MSNSPFQSDSIVDEVVQFNQNLSKGVKNLLEADEISAGVTPREEIYSEDKLKLYRYQPSTGVVQNRIPTLIVYALVNRPYMADIQENRSTIRGLLDTGTDDDVVESARYALRHGMPGGGYIFSTSNCVYPGMRLARYELMLDVWRREGNYAE